jgi:hypothetical protein
MTPTDVINIALTQAGIQASISGLGENSAEAQAANILYTPKVQSLFRAANWNFARKQLSLTQLKAATINGVLSTNPPPVPWLYEYAYPSDCMRARYIIPYFNVSGDIQPPLTTAVSPLIPALMGEPSIQFIVSQDTDSSGNPVKVILTNMQNAILVYTQDITDPGMWDPAFLDAATAYLASWLTNALSRNRAQLGDLISITKEIVADARRTDGDEGPTSADHLPDWMAVRGFSGDFVGRPLFLQSWDLIGFPSGLSF